MNLQFKFSLAALVCFIFATILYFLLNYLLEFPFLLSKFDFSVLYGTTFVSLFVCAKLLEIKPEVVGYTHLSIGVIKLIGITSYLMSDLLNKDEETVLYVLQFFGGYFILQLFELVLLGNQLNKKKF